VDLTWKHSSLKLQDLDVSTHIISFKTDQIWTS